MVLVGPRIASIRRVFERAWGHVRWKMVAIIILMGSSTVLFAGLAVVIVNVVVRRESADVGEKQIQTLVQASGSIASAVLDNVDGCSQERVNSGELKPLLAYTSEAFPGARISLRMEDGLTASAVKTRHHRGRLRMARILSELKTAATRNVPK